MTRAAKPASATIRAAASPGRLLPPEVTVADRAKSDRWPRPWPNPWSPPSATLTRRLQQALTRVRMPAVTGRATAVPAAMITGAPSPRLSTEVRSPRRAAVPTPMKRMGTDSQATTVSMARHGPLNHEVKSGVVVACMAWITPPMAQLVNPPIPWEIECPNQPTMSWPMPPSGSKSESPTSTSADRGAEVEGPGDEEDPGPDDDRPGESGQHLVLGDRGPVDGPVLDPPPQAGTADDQTEQAGIDRPLLDPAEEGRHLGRTRERAVRGDVEAGAQELSLIHISEPTRPY